MNKSSGFTLIELMVVISIVVVLASVGIMVFAGVQRNMRDQQRLRDLDALKQALEMYRSRNQSYPAFLDDLVPEYFETGSSLPQDPAAGYSYQFQVTPADCATGSRNCTSFLLCAKKEGNLSFEYEAECKATDLVCKDAAGDCDMGVVP